MCDINFLFMQLHFNVNLLNLNENLCYRKQLIFFLMYIQCVQVMLALTKKYPVLNTLVSFVESSKEESSSVPKTNSSTEPHSALLNSKVTTFIDH